MPNLVHNGIDWTPSRRQGNRLFSAHHPNQGSAGSSCYVRKPQVIWLRRAQYQRDDRLVVPLADGFANALALLDRNIVVDNIRDDALRPKVLLFLRRESAPGRTIQGAVLAGFPRRRWLQILDSAEHHVATMNGHAVDHDIRQLPTTEAGLENAKAAVVDCGACLDATSRRGRRRQLLGRLRPSQCRNCREQAVPEYAVRH